MRDVTVPTDWLLQGPEFVRYGTLTDLEHRRPDDPDVVGAYSAMLSDPLVQQLIADVNDWEGQRPITRHNDAAHPLHRLVFAAAIGVRADALSAGIRSIMRHQTAEGPFQVRIAIPRAFGGDDQPKWDWVATDAPLVLYALLRLGLSDSTVMSGVDHLCGRIAEPGFPCFAAETMGKFRGPGRKADPCPYANLIILRMLAQVPDRLESPESVRAVQMLLNHWELRRERKYYLFGIGTDFAKPKAPRVWYDIIHFVDTLSRFPVAVGDPRLAEIADLLRSQMDEEGRITARSIWTKWKGWEFCQKREPSRWLTFLAHRALGRLT